MYSNNVAQSHLGFTKSRLCGARLSVPNEQSYFQPSVLCVRICAAVFTYSPRPNIRISFSRNLIKNITWPL